MDERRAGERAAIGTRAGITLQPAIIVQMAWRIVPSSACPRFDRNEAALREHEVVAGFIDYAQEPPPLAHRIGQ
jgi:hypothetical protein